VANFLAELINSLLLASQDGQNEIYAISLHFSQFDAAQFFLALSLLSLSLGRRQGDKVFPSLDSLHRKVGGEKFGFVSK
jgi:hypothetical protein